MAIYYSILPANSAFELISPVLTNGNPADFGKSRVDISADKLKIDFHGAFSQITVVSMLK